MKGNKIKIGIDFHGVITTRPDFFSQFTRLAKSAKCEIHIITGGPLITVSQYLQEHNILYDKIFAIVDYYESLGIVNHLPDGRFRIDNELWDSAKAKYCELNNIDIHIDDSLAYKKWFQTPFCYYTSNLECTTQNKQKVDFSGSAEQALKEILHIIKK